MKWKTPYLGLRGKLVLYLLLPSCLVVGTLLHIYHEDLNAALHQKYIEEALLASTTIQAAISTREILQDQRALQKIVVQFKAAHPQYRMVNIYGQTDEGPLTLASSDPTLVGKVPDGWDLAALLGGKPNAHEEVRDGHKILESSVPISLSGKTIAVIGLYTPMEPRDVLVSHLQSRMLVIGPVGIGILLLIIYLCVNRLVVKPLRKLSRYTEAIAEGNYRIRLATKGSDEVARLGQAFNQMSASIESAREALRESEARFASILDIAHDAIIAIDGTQQIILYNQGAEQIFGYSQFEVLGQSLDLLLPEQFRAIHRSHIAQFAVSNTAARRMGERQGIYGRRKNGEEFPAEATISKLEMGREKIFTVVLRDITERKQVEKDLASLARFPAENPSPVLRVSRDGVLLYANPASQRLLQEWSCEVGQPLPQSWQHLVAGMQESQANKEIEMRVGDTIYLFLFVPVPQSNYINVYGRDITDRKRAEEALAEQAVRDTLTGLYNRRHFNSRIEEELMRADRSKKALALLLCDLDHFKTVNDRQGHQVGDGVLKEVAKGIQDSTRGTDLVFRWGGDEFVIVLSDASRDGVLIAADRIRLAVSEISKQAQLGLDLSIGVALYPDHGQAIDELIRIADRALYIAKKGGDKVHIGEEEYRLDEGAIKVVFQPVVDLGSNEVLGYEALSRDPRSANQILGYEALSRDAEGKLSILELFRRYRAIGRIDELKRICFKAQLKATQSMGLNRVFINVNFDLLNQFEPDTKPLGAEVILEISELEALHDVEAHLKVTRKWREQGYKFAIDDFGAGFISLPFIARLIPDYIKMDRSTILQAVSSAKFRKFLKDLILALQNYVVAGIIAEGIETEKELQVVKSAGIHLVQGFLFGKPQELK